MAKKLFAEAGYDGKPIVIFDSTGVFGLRDEAQVLAQETAVDRYQGRSADDGLQTPC